MENIKKEKKHSLPKGWEIKKLGDVLTIERGGSPRPIKKYLTDSSEGINWIKISDATASNKYIYETKEKITREGLHKTRMVHEGDFLLSNSMSFGRPYIMRTSGCIHDGWLVLKQEGEKVFEIEYLYYLLSSPYLFEQFDSLAAGSTVRNLNIRLVSSVEVPVPPLPEQQRIVSILDKCFSAIERSRNNAEQNLKNAKELFESYLQGVFDPSTRSGQGKGEGWEEKKLGEVYDVRDGTHDSPKYHNQGYPLVTSKNLKNHKLTFDNIKFISETDYLNINKRSKVDVGDVLFAMIGTIGNPVVIEDEPNYAIKNVALFKVGNNQNSYFLKYFLDSKQTIEKMMRDAKGTTQKFVGLGYLRSFPILVPPLKEQQTIVRQLDTLRIETQKLESIYQKKILLLEELKKSILQKAFSGELN
ncbi:MAG: restriction endonuclease subunit S [Bacteroidales bacterium]